MDEIFTVFLTLHVSTDSYTHWQVLYLFKSSHSIQGKYCDKSAVQKRKDKCSGLRRSETCINLLTIHIRLSYSYTHASVVIVDGSYNSSIRNKADLIAFGKIV